MQEGAKDFGGGAEGVLGHLELSDLSHHPCHLVPLVEVDES